MTLARHDQAATRRDRIHDGVAYMWRTAACRPWKRRWIRQCWGAAGSDYRWLLNVSADEQPTEQQPNQRAGADDRGPVNHVNATSTRQAAVVNRPAMRRSTVRFRQAAQLPQRPGDPGKLSGLPGLCRHRVKVGVLRAGRQTRAGAIDPPSSGHDEDLHGTSTLVRLVVA